MVVLFVSDSYRPYVSGVVVSLEWTARQLARLGHQVVLAVPAPGPANQGGRPWLPAPPEAEPGPGSSQPAPLRVVLLPSLPAPGVPGFRFPLPWAAPLHRALRRWGLHPQVVHAHSPFVAGRLALHLGRRLGCPVVFTHHTLYHLYAHYGKLPQGLVRPLTWRYVARYCRRVDGVVAPSEPVRELVVRGYGVTRPVRVIPTGIHLEPFLRASPGPARHRLGLHDEQPLVLYAGRLAREKNVDVLVAALARILARHPSARAVLVGGGPLEGWVRDELARLGLGLRVHLAGPCPPEQMPDWYAACDLFVTASTTETQGLVAVEAMAAGRPVVAPDAGGLKDAVEDGATGFLVRAHPEAIAAACLRLLEDPELRRRMGEQARARAAGYDVARTTAQLAAFYGELCGA